LPNHLLAKKLSSINSKLDALSRELGEQTFLNNIVQLPITKKNKNVVGDYFSDTIKQLEIVEHRVQKMKRKIKLVNDSLKRNSDDLAVANINHEIEQGRQVNE
jgi:hypothetical protein